MTQGEPHGLTQRDAQWLAWSYFQQHASQRVSFFNFFVVLASSMVFALTTAIAQFKLYQVGVVAGMALSATTFVFWKIDERNKMMTKIGEDALREFESNYAFAPSASEPDGCPPAVQIFRREAWLTDRIRNERSALPAWRRQVSMSKSLNLMYSMYALIGLLFAAVSLWAWVASPPMARTTSPTSSPAATAPASVSYPIDPSAATSASAP